MVEDIGRKKSLVTRVMIYCLKLLREWDQVSTTYLLHGPFYSCFFSVVHASLFSFPTSPPYPLPSLPSLFSAPAPFSLLPSSPFPPSLLFPLSPLLSPFPSPPPLFFLFPLLSPPFPLLLPSSSSLFSLLLSLSSFPLLPLPSFLPFLPLPLSSPPSFPLFLQTEATIRFLKAKLRVMQEEMDRLCQENSEKVIHSGWLHWGV